MERIFIGILLISFTQCHLSNITKYYEKIDHVYDKNYSEIDIQKNELNGTVDNTRGKLHKAKIVNNESNQVYLDDVLFALKLNNYTEEEKPCMDQIYLLLQSLQNFTLWAVWMWDAQASEPQGLLYGNRYQLGNFDQCMNAPWSDTHPELKMKYCLADIKLKRTDKRIRDLIDVPVSPYASALDFIKYHSPYTRHLDELTWGACVPRSCLPNTIEKLLAVMLARSHLGTAGIKPNIAVTEPCQADDQQLKFDGLFYAFVSISGLLVVVTLICTYFNYKTKEMGHANLNNNFIRAFCLRENTNDLFKLKKDGIEVFYGIKFLTICLIVLDHQIGIINAGPISNGLSADKDIQSLLGLLVLHDDVFVDSFFFVGGFLTMANLCQIKKLPNVFLLIVKRYIRLIIAFGAVIFYVCAVYPHTGSGPLWNRAIKADAETCRKNWWLNILMVHNYVDIDNMCLVITWYIPCDFHFFVVCILLYYIFKKSPLIGKILAGALTIASIVLPGIITYMYQLSAIQPFTVDFVINPRASKDFNVAYIKSHTRYAPYLVGLFSGYIFIKHNISENTTKFSKKWAILGTASALVFMLGIMVTGSTFSWRNYSPIESAVYAALNRPAWACGLALLIFCCAFGDVPLVKRFLSWYPWVPLSRLSYGLYLAHIVIISRNVFVARNPQHNDYFNILTITAGTIFWGCIAALILWFLAEAPVNKLLGFYLKSKVHESSEQREVKQAEGKNVGSISFEQLNEKFSSTAHLSSKM